MIINGGKEAEESKEERKSEQDGEGDEDNLNLDEIGKKRKREDEPVEDDRTKRRMRATEYYSGDFYSKSCSYLLYCLGVQLNKQSVDSFWLWILGLTDQLIHSKISALEYDEEYDKCRKEFLSITNQNFNQENDSYRGNQQNADLSIEKKFDSKGYFYQNVDLTSDNFKVGSIIPSQEFRFMFMRAWSLYNSAFYSEYVAIKLKLWEDAGKKELDRFFVTMGIPQHEYNQQYKFMSPKYKKFLKNKVEEIAPKFGLENLLFSSFVRQINNKTQLNASDMVYVVNSLLESPKPVLIDNIPDLDQGEELKKMVDDYDPNAFSMEDYQTQKIENFWAAYNSLNIKNTDFINCGISLSKELQKGLISQGTNIITSKKVIPCTHFRYSIINTDVLSEIKIFQHPLSLQKLALFIMEAYSEKKRNKEMKPMVLAVKNTVKDSYLVVGVLGKNNSYTRDKNEFGSQFREAAEKVDAQFSHDGFDTSLLEINTKGFEEFFDEVIQV